MQTLRFLTKWHGEVVRESELITVCQDTYEPGTLIGWAKHKHFNLDLGYMHLPFVTNFGVDKATNEKLIILESDRILPPGYFAEVIEQLQDGLQITTKKMLRPQKDLIDREIESGDFEYKEEYRNEAIWPGERNMWSGNTALTKSDYYGCGQMDEFYKGYGWADGDMTLTMEKHGVKSIYRDELEIHLWHEANTYGDEGDKKQMFLDNGVYYCRKWGIPFPVFLREGLAERRPTII